MNFVQQHKTAEELVAAWDRGESVWTIECGGLGPGYEQAIQVAAVEFARATLGFERTGDDKADYARFGELCDAALKPIDGKLGGITGAMYGQAKWLAWQWVCNGGPAKLVEKAEAEGEKDRVIQCSKAWPRLEE